MSYRVCTERAVHARWQMSLTQSSTNSERPSNGMAAEVDRPVLRRSVLVAGVGGAAIAAGAALTGCSREQPESTPTTLTPLDKVPVGGATLTNGADGKPVVVVRPQADTAVAFSAVCTHMGCTVTQIGDQLFCPCHGSAFELTTGRVVSGPATRPLRSVPVRVANGDVVSA